MKLLEVLKDKIFGDNKASIYDNMSDLQFLQFYLDNYFCQPNDIDYAVKFKMLIIPEEKNYLVHCREFNESISVQSWIEWLTKKYSLTNNLQTENIN